jgi:hypothetical protein
MVADGMTLLRYCGRDCCAAVQENGLWFWPSLMLTSDSIKSFFDGLGMYRGFDDGHNV